MHSTLVDTNSGNHPIKSNNLSSSLEAVTSKTSTDSVA